ncbi:hypothetical protein P7K49_015119 [Saguinus oedipus]|uniref:Uncharacterized protein n=1 Tax=Saguinus oedipus TaxID=9490 RepID=A0ABQ9V8C6_SAGOE|nr:hypothetical protein P7K49_015119 [Saguinus oedipus]
MGPRKGLRRGVVEDVPSRSRPLGDFRLGQAGAAAEPEPLTWAASGVWAPPARARRSDWFDAAQSGGAVSRPSFPARAPEVDAVVPAPVQRISVRAARGPVTRWRRCLRSE